MYVSVILQLIQPFPEVRNLVPSIIPLLHIFALPELRKLAISIGLKAATVALLPMLRTDLKSTSPRDCSL
jgi:hypothetical protein